MPNWILKAKEANSVKGEGTTSKNKAVKQHGKTERMPSGVMKENRSSKLKQASKQASPQKTLVSIFKLE